MASTRRRKTADRLSGYEPKFRRIPTVLAHHHARRTPPSAPVLGHLILIPKPRITAELCAFPLTSAVTDRDVDPRHLRVSLSQSDLAGGCHQRSTAELPVERHPERELATSRTT